MVSVQSTVSGDAGYGTVYYTILRCTIQYYSTVAVMQSVTWSSGNRVCD